MKNEPVTIIVKHRYGDKPLSDVMLPIIVSDLQRRVAELAASTNRVADDRITVSHDQPQGGLRDGTNG